MKNLQKIISGIISTAMMFSSTAAVFAAEPSQFDNDSIAYSIADSDNSVRNVMQSELDNGGWDMSKIGNQPIDPYVDFPMSVESNMDNHAKLSLGMLYLKNISASDTVTVEMKERDTNQQFLTKTLTSAEDYVKIADIPIGKTYNVKLDETLGGVHNVYNAVIETYYDSNIFPEDVSLTASTNSADTKLKITEERTEANAGEALENYTLRANQLPQRYQSLSNDKLYIIQLSQTENGQYDITKAFFSKEASKQDLGIFVPAHRFHTESEYEGLYGGISLFSNPVSAITSSNSWTIDNLNSEATAYVWDRDIFMNMPANNKTYKLFKINVTENSYYTFKTIGNYDVYAAYWVKNPDSDTISKNVIRRHPTNINDNIGFIEGAIVYVLIDLGELTDGSSAKTVFNASRSDVSDDVTNSLYELSNPESGTPSYSSYNTVMSHTINYGCDVDVFYINRNSDFVDRYYSIRLKNNCGINYISANATLFVDQGDSGGVFEDTDSSVQNVSNDETDASDFRMTENYKYFVEVKLSTRTAVGNYELSILRPDAPDYLEGTTGNNTQATASTFPNSSGYFSPVTLHYGDVDCYKFNTGSGGATARFTIFKTTSGKLYNIKLSSASSSDVFGDSNGTTASRNRITATGLLPNTDYYLTVYPSGTNYSPGTSYELDYTITRN